MKNDDELVLDAMRKGPESIINVAALVSRTGLPNAAGTAAIERLVERKQLAQVGRRWLTRGLD